MAVVRLKARRDAKELAGLEALRAELQNLRDVGAPQAVLGRLVATVERELVARRGWRFIMVEPYLNAAVVTYLSTYSRRPLKAVQLWARLFAVLPHESNEVQASRTELGRLVGIRPSEVSEIMGELEEVGAIYRRREGRSIRYFVHPELGTHLKGEVRDRAQEEAPELSLPAA